MALPWPLAFLSPLMPCNVQGAKQPKEAVSAAFQPLLRPALPTFQMACLSPLPHPTSPPFSSQYYKQVGVGGSLGGCAIFSGSFKYFPLSLDPVSGSSFLQS